MAGLPVIAADIPALREVLAADGQTTARFVSKREVPQWTAAISAASETRIAPAHRCVCPVIQEKYSERRMMDAYVALYRELIS